MEFESAPPSVVKSIKQRDLLNTWLRLYARNQSMPRMAEYQPERIEDELPDLVYYTVDTHEQPPRLTIQSDGTRTWTAPGHQHHDGHGQKQYGEFHARLRSRMARQSMIDSPNCFV